MAKTYQECKEKAREEAKAWQLDFANNNHSYEEIGNVGGYFAKLAKRYGLTKEFKENGII